MSLLSINEKTHYAIVLIAALTQVKTPLSLSDLADRLNFSQGYLEEVAARLKSSGLIVSTRGRNGGYMLKDESSVTVKDIVEAIDGVDASRSTQSVCPSHDISQKIQCILSEKLGQVTINEILSSYETDLSR